MQAAIANQRSTMQSIRFISMKRTCFKSDFYDISYLFQIKVIKHSSSGAETVEIASTKSGSRKSSESLPSMFMSLDECVNIGLDCIYSYESDEESELIVEMAQFLKKKCMSSRLYVLGWPNCLFC